VTGASSGIGRDFAIALAREGYEVIAVARREDRLRALVEGLDGSGHRYVCADLATAEGLHRVCETVETQRVQLLVNNAGYSMLRPFQGSSLADQQRILDVNCRAVLTIAHAYLDRAQPGDALVNVGSVVGFLPTPAQAVYSASKAFVTSLSECLWEEQRHRDVYVMALCPGITSTEFIYTATDGKADGRNLPRLLVQTGEEVVAEALRALRRRKKAVIVTGRVNRAMLQIPRFLSRHALLKLLAVAGSPERAL